MMSNNKILTVSYGTFSCTLEGFDDSFGTMKAIAEYFRDLAADDRYFGAEPPQPDAEMLARIAQKEISRRVEASEHEGKIALRAVETDEPAEATAPVAVIAAPVADDLVEDAEARAAVEEADDTATDAQALEVPPEEVAVDPKVTAALADDAEEEEVTEVVEDHPTTDVMDEVEEDDVDIVPGQPDAEVEAFFSGSEEAEDALEDAGVSVAAVAAAPAADSIAAKLQRIRAVVAQTDDAEDEEDYSEDEHAVVQDQPDRNAEVEAETSTDAEPQDVMAEARRDIEDALDADVEATQQKNAEDAAAEVEIDADETLSQPAQDTSEEVETPAAPVEAQHDDDDDDIADIMSRLDLAEAEEPMEAESLVADVAADDDDDLSLENLFEDEAEAHAESEIAATLAEDDADQEEEVAQEAADQDAAERPETNTRVLASKELVLEEQQTETEKSEDAPVAPRARVIKVKRADLEAAIARGELEEYEEEEDRAEAAQAPAKLDELAPARNGESSLSQEEEDDLARELAEIDAELASAAAAGQPEPADETESTEEAQDTLEDNLDKLLAEDTLEDAPDAVEAIEEDSPETLEADEEEATDDAHAVADIDDEAPVEQEEASQPSGSGRDKLRSIDEARDQNMDRLMAEADSQMDEPESAVRRDAFAQLRAAVAAKKADEAMGQNDDTVRGDDAYRNDLADVVRPRRPVGGGEKRTQRPGARPAPLKLVAEQRIDMDGPKPAGPVRPRRVAATADASEAVDSGFAEYAEEMGATKLPEVLEAAASYLAFVEGRDQFSRPQLMTKVRQAGPEGFSREDTLRSFGALLRDGKIEKIKGGRFVASEDIGFRPDARAAG